MSYLHFGTCLWLLLLATGALRRGSRLGRNLLFAGVTGLFLWSWPPSAALFCRSLEQWYRPAQLPSSDAGAIVVLGASIYPRDASQPEVLPGFATYLRCRYAAWLYRTWKARPVLTTGGPGGDGEEPAIIADVMAQTLQEAGVPRSMIWTERASRSTYENAVYSARILREKGIGRIVLVTEASHMLRAEASFRKQGLEVLPSPSAFRSYSFRGSWMDLAPSASKMLDSDECLHEWAGLTWYWFSNKI